MGGVGGRELEAEGRAVAQRPHVVVGGREQAQQAGRRALPHVQPGGRQEARGAVVHVRHRDAEGGGGGQGRRPAVHGHHPRHALAARGRLAVQGAAETHGAVRAHTQGVPATLHAVVHLLQAALGGGEDKLIGEGC